MFRFQWSKEVLTYFRDNEDLINELELAFAEYRERGARTPEQGIVDMIAPLHYIYGPTFRKERLARFHCRSK